jgi:tripartite motif-containing protein 71
LGFCGIFKHFSLDCRRTPHSSPRAGDRLASSFSCASLLQNLIKEKPSVMKPEIVNSSFTFNLPTGLAIDAKGNLYVLDSGNHHVLKFDKTGNLILGWGKFGTDCGEFNFYEDRGTVCGIAIDYQGNVFVVDKGNYRIQKFDGEGNFLTAWGGKGKANGQFIRPIYVASDVQGHVFDTDDRNPMVQKFDNNGQFLLKWGGLGDNNGQFKHATAIAADSEGNIYISDYENERVQKFNNDGLFLTSWSTGENEKSGTPEAIAIDGSDKIYVTDSELNQVEVFDKAGVSLKTIKLPRKGLPYGIAIDSEENLYVSDRQKNRIMKYKVLL